MPDTTVSPEGRLMLTVPVVQHAGVPGGGGVARAADIATVPTHDFLRSREINALVLACAGR